MLIFKEKKALLKYLPAGRSATSPPSSIGYVPTMGALHAGHVKLLERAVAENKITISSVFVNPTQFNDQQDYERYPVQIDKDIQTLVDAGISILYLPEVEDVYPEGMQKLEHFNFGLLETIAEGAHRPGHFQGVGQVLSRFLTIIQPDNMYMGQKDYQQLLITQRLVEIIDLPTKIVGVPTEREEDGLALSSRNARLSQEGRKVAPAIYRALCRIEEHRKEYYLENLVQKATQSLKEQGIEVEYLMLADAHTLKPAKVFSESNQVLLIAAWLEGIRLIDNILLKND